MKLNLLSLVMAVATLPGCETTEPPVTTAPEPVQVIPEPQQQIKPARCGMSPPILNKQKIQQMLIKAGTIAPDATPEQMAQQVKQYIANKQRAFAKKCRG